MLKICRTYYKEDVVEGLMTYISLWEMKLKQMVMEGFQTKVTKTRPSHEGRSMVMYNADLGTTHSSLSL